MAFQARKIAAGGHQGYAPCGGLFTQSKPLDPHVYGAVPDQMQQLPVHSLKHFYCTRKQ